MKLVGLLITAVLLAILMSWWINLTLLSTEKVTAPPPQIEKELQNQGQTGTAPLDYSRQKVEEVNELNQERSEEINDLLR